MPCRRLYLRQPFFSRSLFPVGGIYSYYIKILTGYSDRILQIAEYRLYFIRKSVFFYAFIKQFNRLRHYLNAVYLFGRPLCDIPAHNKRYYTTACAKVADLVMRRRICKIRKEKCVRTETVVFRHIYLDAA